MILKYQNLTFTLLLLVVVMFASSCDTKPTETEEQDTDETEVATTDTDTDAEKVEEGEQPPQIASPRKQAEGKIGSVSVTVDYGSPGVKGREIWGGLEEYGVVWRAGANETTSIEFSNDVMIGDTEVKAGKYGLYMIPNETKPWIVIINTDWNREQHGAWGAYNYTKDNDVARVEVTPEASGEVTERLEYTVESDGIGFAWERIQLQIPVSPASGE